MHTVVETDFYLSAAKAAGMKEAERDVVIDTLSLNPLAGDEIAGTGGCRKVRIAGRGKGKSGGYRVVTFFGGADLPVYLMTAYSKGAKEGLSKSERNELAKLTTLVAGARPGKRRRR